MKPYLIILLAVCGFAGLHPSVVRAQNGTSLPTSMYGIGELAAGDGGRYGLGLVYAPSIRIGHDNRHTYENSSSTNETEDKSSPSRSQYLPMRLGAGVSVTGSRCVLALDYTYADWSRNVSAVSAMGYENQHKLNMGAIVVASPRRMRSVEWMGGIGLSNSYLTLQGRRMYSLEVSAGSSIPIGFSFLSLGATWRKQLNGSRHVMQESRFSLNLSLTFGERLSRSRLQ